MKRIETEGMSIQIALRTLRVSEVFVSFQGEGPSGGERAVFLRLAGCNLSCVWCDSAYTWDWSSFKREEESGDKELGELASQLDELAQGTCRLLVLTGGEPLIQQHGVVKLLKLLSTSQPKMRCEVETNGTIVPSVGLAAFVHRFVVSPKLANSCIDQRRRIQFDSLREFASIDKSAFKFVVERPEDFDEIRFVCDAAGIPSEQVWIMPQARTSDDCLQGLRLMSEYALTEGYNLSSRLHILLWEDKRGR
jgi:organic radical activating enzyme